MNRNSCSLGMALLLAAGWAAAESAKPAPGQAPSEAASREITPRMRRAIDQGLVFLSRAQNKDGSWSDGGYRRHVGITGIACMALMSQGNLPGRGRYGRQVKRATEFLIRSTDRRGLIAGDQVSHGPMYGHGFAALCLAEVYGMTANARTGRALRLAIKLIVRTQNPQGGWRYQPVASDADLSVTICQIQALRAARNAGVPVPRQTIDRALGYVTKSARPDGSFTYTLRGGHSTFALTAAGVTALYGLGRYDLPEVQRGLKRLLSVSTQQGRGGHYYYGHYYAAQAMFQSGDSYWSQWFPRVRDELLERQKPDGSFQGEIGPVYSSGMALLILQIPYRYLPIFQR